MSEQQQKQFKVGDRVRQCGREGTVVEITPVQIRVNSDDWDTEARTGWSGWFDRYPVEHVHPATPAPACEPEVLRWEDVEFRHFDDSPWVLCPAAADLPHWGQHLDRKLSYRHARTHEPIAYSDFLAAVNRAKANLTAPQVAQAAEVYAGMQRQEFWCQCAAECIGKQLNGHEWSVGDAGFSPRVYEVATREAGKFADAMLAEFDKRFGKGGA